MGLAPNIESFFCCCIDCCEAPAIPITVIGFVLEFVVGKIAVASPVLMNWKWHIA